MSLRLEDFKSRIAVKALKYRLSKSIGLQV